MAQLRDLIGPLLIAAPGCPEPLATQRLREAAREFCTETRAYRAPVATLLPEGAHYPLTAPAHTEVFDTVYVRLDDKPLRKSTREGMQGLPGHTPSHYRIEHGALVLAPLPRESILGRTAIEAVLRPQRNARELEDTLLDRFSEIFEWGALARLLTTPNQSWTDFSAAQFFGAQFAAATTTWRSQASDAGQQGVARKVRYGGL